MLAEIGQPQGLLFSQNNTKDPLAGGRVSDTFRRCFGNSLGDEPGQCPVLRYYSKRAIGGLHQPAAQVCHQLQNHFQKENQTSGCGWPRGDRYRYLFLILSLMQLHYIECLILKLIESTGKRCPHRSLPTGNGIFGLSRKFRSALTPYVVL